MRFAHPDWLWLLTLLPVFFLAMTLDLQKRRTMFLSMISSVMIPRLVPGFHPRSRFYKLIFLFLSVSMVIVALARPQWGKIEETVQITGLDLMLVMDISNSMWVEDVPPSRLKLAKRFALSFLKRLTNDRVGLVAFAGSAYLASPLTTDMDYLVDMTESLSPELISSQGTDIGAALETAVDALERGAEISTQVEGERSGADSANSPSSRAIILISDGENLEGDLASSIKKVKESGIKVFIFGVGTEAGGRIPIREHGNLRGYKQDQMGQDVTSRFDSTALKGLASTTQGKFWTLTASDNEVLVLLQELGLLQSQDLEEKTIARYHERYQIPLAAAIFFLLCELSISLTRRRMVPNLAAGKNQAATLTLVLLCLNNFFVSDSHAGWLQDTVAQMADSLESYKKNQQGIDAYDKGQLGLAKEKFGDAHAKSPLAHELIYNQSLIHAREQRFAEAIEGFTQSLEEAKVKGDPVTEQRSLYNLGILLSQNRNFSQAAQKMMEGMKSAQKNGDQKMEKQFREGLQKLQEQMVKPSKGKGNKGDGEDGDEEGDGKSKGSDDEREKNRDKGPVQSPRYESKKLYKEDAEKVIDDLTREEKKIQMKLMEQKSDRKNSEGKEW